MMNITGRKYDAKLSTKEIAAAFRADVKQAQKDGEIPKDLKLSVRIRTYAGGASIDVVIKQAPEGLAIMNPEYVLQDKRDFRPTPRHTDAARALLERLKGMLNAYNYDNSDAMVDHFDVRFYGHVDFDGELEREERIRIEMLSDKGAEWETWCDTLVRGLLGLAGVIA
jgi:hypothetical protein